MKNFTQLLPGRDGSNAKTNNTSGRMRGGIRFRIGSMSLKNTSLFGVILALMLTFGVGEVWADSGFFSSNQWKIGYNDGAAHWTEYQNDGATVDLGIKTTLSLIGCNVKTWGYVKTNLDWWKSFDSSLDANDSGTGNFWYIPADWNGDHEWYMDCNDYNMITEAPNNPGNNTLYMKWSLRGYNTKTGQAKVTFTIPGFKNTSASQTFDNTTVGSNSSKTISFGQHYGTALSTSNCALSGTNSTEFEVTSISETGVTVKFKPSTAGNKSATLTITDAHSKTCTITLSGKTQYTVTYNKGTYGTGSDKTANKVYGTNLTLRGSGDFTRTGYSQTAWNTNANGTSGTSYALSGTYSSEEAITLYPTWTVNSYDITYSPSPAVNFTYTTAPSSANYGDQVDFTFTPATNYIISSVTAVDESSNSVTVTKVSANNYRIASMPASAITVTVTPALGSVKLTYGAGDNGSLSAKVDDVTTNSGKDSDGGSQVDFTATPNTGYEVEGWYTSYSAGVFSGKIDAAGTNTTYTIAEATSDITVYVKFVLSTYTITYSPSSAPTGCTYTTKPTTGTYGNPVTMVITPSTGYTVSVSACDASSNVVTISNPSPNTYTFTQPASAVTVTVSTSQIMSTLTTSNSYNVGDPSYAAPTKSNSSIGIATTATLTATPPSTGYTFTGWTLSNNLVVTSGNAATDLSITVRTDGNGAAATAQANYTEDLTSPWHLLGVTTPFGGWDKNVSNMLTKETGSSTASVASIVVPVSALPSAEEYTFKLYNANTGVWRTYSGYWVTRENNNPTLSTEGGTNMIFKPDVTGNYVFTLNYSGASPVLTVTYPTAYTLTYSIGSIAGNNGSISTNPTTSSGSKVLSGHNVTLTAPEPNTGYTWKGWYTDAAGTTGKIDDTNRAITVKMNADKTLYACYTINNHAITHSAALNGSYTIKVGDASAVSTNTTSDFGKTITLAATPETGYHFGSWTAYKTGTPGTTVTVTNNQFTMPDYAVTVGATFLINTYTIAFNANDENYVGTATGTTASIPATYGVSYTLTSNGFSRAGYRFAGWSSEPDGSGTQYDNEQTGVSNLTAENGATVTLYAQYRPNDYTVTFDANGGTCGTASKPVTFNAAYGYLPEATKDAKGFVGWYTTPSGDGTQVTAETIVSTANNHTLYARFEDTYSVTIQYKSGNVTLKPNGSTTASAHALSPEITAPEFLGYTFTGWTGSNAAIFANASSATTTVNVTAATTITANYSAIPTVYFKNNLGWEHVYVTFDAYYGEAGGATVPGQKGKPYYEMTQMGKSDIFYCVIPDAIVSSWKTNIAFDNKGYASTDNKGTYGLFHQGEFIGRSDFASEATMFIPYNGDKEARNGGTYYRTGCWMKYNSTDPGYKVYANTYKEGSDGSAVAGTPALLTADIAGGYEFKATIKFPNANYTYGFMLKKEATSNTNDLWYTNTSDIYASTTTLPWDFTAAGASENGKRCGLHTEATGNYVITVSFATGKPMVDVTYPVSTGDWKLIYKDRATWSNGAHTADWQHPSRVIKAKAGAEDIVSFYVAHGSTPSVELHKCTNVNALTGAQTWVYQSDVDLREITKTGIYNFKVTQDGGKNATVTVDGAYVGNFYIRTDVSDGGWSNYKTSGTNTMTYSEYAEENSGFTHYFMRYVHTGTNIKFCIANDYSECISDTLVGDSFTGEYIAVYGNVRFMWDQRTNKVSRAYISGSTNVYDRFLVLQGDAKMFNKAGTALTTGNGRVNGLNEYEMNFTDDQNWIYEATVQAQPGARFKLTARYNNQVQYFYGDEGATEQLLGGDGESTTKYTIRIVYDFKTNRLIKAFIPSGTISDNLSIEADLMIIREHQEDAQQINFTGSVALSNVKTVYGAMKFNKWTVNGKEKTDGHASTGDSRYKRDLFYISFPFDVKLSEVFGFGTYGTHWIIEYYDGKGRAKNGFWADSDSYWKFVLPSQRNSFTLKAFEGYILALDLDEMTESSSIWNHGVEDVYVYFPSSAAVNNIQATNRLIPIDQEGYQCQIGPRFEGGDDRRVKDSYWHVIGVPSFANYNSPLTETNGGTAIDWRTPSLPYLYEWNSADNSLAVTTSATFDFKATYSYMVQYAGTSIYWSAINATPPSVVARKNDNQPTSAEFRLELQQTGKAIDQTFVRLTDEVNVTTGFDFNYDLSKEMNANKANIFTMITTAMDDGNTVTESAANCLPMSEQTTVVPVGVKIAANDDYTFSIPDGANGVGVTLIDNLTGTRTNLSAVDYTVSLEAGTYNERFTLEISPIQYLPTELEQSDINNQMSDVRKVLIDGLLYIVHDNKMYDARGARVE